LYSTIKVNAALRQDCAVQKRFVTYTSSDVEFFDCTWSSIPVAAFNGGGINFESIYNGHIAITECTFVNLTVTTNAYRGAGFYLSSVESVNISSSTVTNSSAQYYGGGEIYNVTKCILVHNCKCEGTTGAAQCGGIHVSLYYLPLPFDCGNHSSRGTVFGCTFRRCTTPGLSGGVYFENPPVGGSVRSLNFDSCTAGSAGGEIYLGDVVNMKSSSLLFFGFFLQ
jgi:hypothetical protein